MFTRSSPRTLSLTRSAACAVAAGLGALLLAGIASAADELEAVVVTAPHYVPTDNRTGTKTDTPLVETPQSITVINRDQIDLLTWQNLGQAVRYTSGVVGENFGSDERYDWLTLRGFYPVQYVDGLQAPVGSVTNIGLDLYNSQSVEVLKGPASVLYGLAPPGGIVNMTSRRPSRDFGGEVQAHYGSHDDKQLAGDITGAVTDNLSLRLTALSYDRDTQTRGVRSKRTYVAPALTWDIADRTSITFLYYYQWDDVKGDGGGFFPAAGIYSPNPNGPTPTDANLGDPAYNDFSRSQYAGGYSFKHGFSDNLTFSQDLKYFSTSNTMFDVYGAGFATSTTPGTGLYPYLNPLTGVQESDFSGNPLYTDYRTVNRYNFPFWENIHSFEVDNRLEAKWVTGAVKHDVLFGLDYRRYVDKSKFAFGFGPTTDLYSGPVATPITTPSPAFPYTDEIQRQTGLYAQDQMKVDHWIFTVGARQDWVKSTYSGADRSDDKLSYRGGVTYLLPNGLAPYVSYANSFQPTAGSSFAGEAFKPTTGKQVEAGLKFEPTFLPRDVKLFATAAAYKITQDNVLAADPGHAFFSLQVGQVEVKGAELELVTRIRERLSLNASYSYTKSEVTQTASATDPTLGRELPIVPRHKVSLFVDYTAQTGAVAGLGGGLGIRYLSSTYGDPTNLWQAPSYTLLDAVIHYNVDKWLISVDASNLTNKTYISQCSSEVNCFYGLKRKVVGTVSRKF
ncbi:MAG: TonB-dependent siderophore receptor [Proteobacteria bacterium]|nr:TonB-dependent siderophore receptor [Pseudomonadota bacterium]